MDLMIDIEALATGPDATILTIAAQTFNPFGTDITSKDKDLYQRINVESQPNRAVDDATIKWWAEQPSHAKEEAFGEAWRVDIREALEKLGKMVFHCDRIWANGPTFDMNILEHAYKEQALHLPWRFYKVRDCRTVYSLWPSLPQPPTTHHALEDCRRQIKMLQDTLEHLQIRSLK